MYYIILKSNHRSTFFTQSADIPVTRETAVFQIQTEVEYKSIQIFNNAYQFGVICHISRILNRSLLNFRARG